MTITYAESVSVILASLEDATTTLDQPPAARRLVTACVAALPVDGAAIMWMTEVGPGTTLAATDEPGRVLEGLQFGLGEGPCIDSAATVRPVLCPDLRASGADRWPAYTLGALRAGVGAVFAFPLAVGGTVLGVLDLYRRAPGRFTSADLLVASIYASAATALLLRVQAAAEADGAAPEVETAIAERAHVYQASGMIAGEASVDLPTALAMLRARAYSSDRHIDDVAHDVVAGRIRFS